MQAASLGVSSSDATSTATYKICRFINIGFLRLKGHLLPVLSWNYILCLGVLAITNQFKRTMPTSNVKIRVEYNHKDFETDMFCVLFELIGDKWKEVRRTEVVPNSSKASWDTTFDFHFNDKENQIFKFEVYDENLASEGLRSKDVLESMDFPLCALIELAEGLNLEGPFLFHVDCSNEVAIRARDKYKKIKMPCVIL